MNLLSKDLKNYDIMDKKFTCDGENINPHLQWEDFPAETKSFALFCIDHDSKIGKWIHWYIYNLPSDTFEIYQDGSIPGIQLENDFGKNCYGGPCPEKGTHRYFFTLYALNIKHLHNVTQKNFITLVEEHSIDSAKLISLYRRKL